MRGDGQVHLWGKVVFTASGNTLSGTLQACGIVLPPTTLTALGRRRHDPDRGPDRRLGRPEHAAFPGRRDADRLERRRHADLQLRGAGRVHHRQPHDRALAVVLHRHHDDERRGRRHERGAHGDPAHRRPATRCRPLRSRSCRAPTRSTSSRARSPRRRSREPRATRPRAPRRSRTSTTTSWAATSWAATTACPTEVNFVDQNRTIYQVTSATAQTKIVADTATCADVRAALPM